MVRQAYVNRLVLGRSAYDPPSERNQDGGRPALNGVSEISQAPLAATTPGQYVQQYNSRGYPDNREARHFARRNRHAQNDILTTIGVCVSVDEQEGGGSDSRAPKTSSERHQAGVIIEEHWYGSSLGSLTEICSEASTLWVKYLRRRTQVFKAYSTTPLPAIIRFEWRRASRLSFLAAGLIPDISYHGLKGFVEGVWEALQEYIGRSAVKLAYDYLPFEPERLVHIVAFLFKLSVRSTRIILEILLDNLIMLQKLHLIESWPPVSRQALSAVLSLGPSAPRIWSLASIATFARASVQSPYVLCFAYNLVEESLREKLFAYMQTIMVRPDNPDASSFRLELDDDRVDPSEATVLRLPIYQRTFTEQFLLDYGTARHSAIGMIYRARETFAQCFWWLSSQEPVQQRLARRASTGRSRILDTSAPPAVSFAPDSQTVGHADTSDFAEHEPIQRRGPPSPDPNITPPQSPGGSSSDAISEIDPSAVQVRTRSGSTSTLHMDLEVQLPMNSQGVQERRHNSFTTSEQSSVPVRRIRDPSSDHYRVTQLTVHSSTTLSVQLALVLSSAILVPLESLYLRSLARSFLATQSISASRINDLVYSPTRLGLRSGDWKGIMAYSGQVLLCFGMETVLRLYFWRICGSVSLWWGRSKFGWGRL